MYTVIRVMRNQSGGMDMGNGGWSSGRRSSFFVRICAALL